MLNGESEVVMSWVQILTCGLNASIDVSAGDGERNSYQSLSLLPIMLRREIGMQNG